MSDIFISYSSNDRDKAEQLSELLASGGVSVWIDRQGIVGAEKWATEIVEGINSCSTFLLLISPHSIESENVLRELSLASEKRKRVLPVVLKRVLLPSSFEYPLAGLQQVEFSDIDGILHAHKHGVSKVVVKDTRKSLIILPFEDLSPAKDNQWFADGLSGEMIDAFSRIKSLRILDRKTSRDLRGVKQSTKEIAMLFDTRFVVEGTITKIGDRIKISVSLLDMETNEHLWQESYKGVMDDIFELQESVAEQIVAGLKLQLTKEEKSLLAERGTENADAYELFMKALEFFGRHTKEGYQLSIQLSKEAISLDPGFAQTYMHTAEALVALYRSYDRRQSLLEEAEQLAKDALRLKPDLVAVYGTLSKIYLYQGRLVESEEAAHDFVRTDPKNRNSHFVLGFFYSGTGQKSKAIAHYEEAARLKPDYLNLLFSLANACEEAKELERRRTWSETALPAYQRHLKLHPDDEFRRANHAVLLFWAGRREEAHQEAILLKQARDGHSLFNTSNLFSVMDEPKEAIEIFRKAIEAGFRNLPLLKVLLTEGLASLAGTPEYEEVERILEKIEAEAEEKSNV